MPHFSSLKKIMKFFKNNLVITFAAIVRTLLGAEAKLDAGRIHLSSYLKHKNIKLPQLKRIQQTFHYNHQ